MMTKKLDSFLINHPKYLYTGLILMISILFVFGLLKTELIYQEAHKTAQETLNSTLRSSTAELDTIYRHMKYDSEHLLLELTENILEINYHSKITYFLNRYSDLTDRIVIKQKNTITEFKLSDGNKLNITEISDLNSGKSLTLKNEQLSVFIPIELKHFVNKIKHHGSQDFLISYFEEGYSTHHFWKTKILDPNYNCQLVSKVDFITASAKNLTSTNDTLLDCKDELAASVTVFYPFKFQEKPVGFAITVKREELFASIDESIHLLLILLLLSGLVGITFFFYTNRIQKVIEIQNRVADARLAQASKLSSIGEMSSNIAHEINNPLSVILGSSSLLKHELAALSIKSERASRQIEKIESMVNRISKIIRALRTFSRDAETVEMTSCNLSHVIDESLDLVRQKAKSKDIEVKTNYPNEEIFVLGNYVQLGQVMINLVSNAIDSIFSDPNKSGSYINVEIEFNRNKVMVHVEDNGPGIPKDLASKIFEPFFTTKPVGQGTGLGLSISIGIIRSHHGKIFVSSLSKPTRITIELPRETASQKKTA